MTKFDDICQTDKNLQRSFAKYYVLFFDSCDAVATRAEWPADIWHALWKVTPNDAGLKIQLTPCRPGAKRTCVYVYMCIRTHVFFFTNVDMAVVSKLHCLYREPRGAKTSEGAQFWKSHCQKLIVGQTDWLIDLIPFARVCPAQSVIDLPPLCRSRLLSIPVFFYEMTLYPGKK